MRWLLTLVVLTGLITPPALSQQTRTEEMERREHTLATLPPHAAKRIFGMQERPASLGARAIGSFAKGCLAGAVALPVDGPNWQVMRLSRNRNWGHLELIRVIERIAARAPNEAGWRGLLVGDMSQPRGGPMLTGHASHQIGLDADVWLTPSPPRRLTHDEREMMSATNLVRPDWLDIDPARYTPSHLALIRLAASEPNVSRIFVNPAIKKALCRDAGKERAWLSKVRPTWGHNYHFHLRLACPAGEASCVDQPLPQDGDGCGLELADWLAKQDEAMNHPKPLPKNPKPPPPPMTLDDLPAECRAVAAAR